jgi:hypothetical protein
MKPSIITDGRVIIGYRFCNPSRTLASLNWLADGVMPVT